MPLLHRRPFRKVSPPEGLTNDREVFYCDATDEIFLNYEDFSERMFLCTSMVWTCALSGKSNLTYAEALEHEQVAREQIKNFPHELKIPVLYMASIIKRLIYNELVDEVFTFIKDRFFVGEHVEAFVKDNKWKTAQVIRVLDNDDKEKKATNNGTKTARYPHPTSYKYEVEDLITRNDDISEIWTVTHNHLRRKKTNFNKDKFRIYLRQYVEQDSLGVYVLQPLIYAKLNIANVKFTDIFLGDTPDFRSKKVEKAILEKKSRHQQQLIDKFLTKSTDVTQNGINNSLLEKMKQKEEELKLKKQQKKEEHLALKQKKKEESMELAAYLKAWYKPKDDLELNDQKILPPPTPVKSKVPDKYFGDMLMVLEFVHTFSKLLSTKDFFPSGLTIEVIERALLEKEVAGPLVDLIQMFLVAIFNVQDQENAQCRIEFENPSSIKTEDHSNSQYREATRRATAAVAWIKKYQGLPLERLPLYSLTTSEILRLHLLGSGAIIKYGGARWRYQERGGYTSEDDPGVELRLRNPHIVKALSIFNIVELSILDKLTVLSCLINQLLTYADVRDVVEEGIETDRQIKNDYRALLAIEKRREQEFLSARAKLKKENKGNETLPQILGDFENKAEREKKENDYKLEQFKKTMYKNDIMLGHDRAYCQYLKLKSVPGLFVTSEEQNPGRCLDHIVTQDPELINVNRDEIQDYLQKKFKEKKLNGQYCKTNGVHNGLDNDESYKELRLCSSDFYTCIVHNPKLSENKWSFYHDTKTFNNVVDNLNRRGIREGQLAEILSFARESIERLILETPKSALNRELPITEEGEAKRSKKNQKSKYENANLGYPTDMEPEEVLHTVLVENILAMEDKIFAGNLGCIAIKDRELWRNCLHNRTYSEFDKTLKCEDVKREKRAKSEESNHSDMSSDYQDPGHYLNTSNDDTMSQKAEIKDAIHCLAIALAQVGRSVEPKFLKKPLGKAFAGKQYTFKEDNMLHKWEQSLLASTSFSQVFLHYGTLDSCVMWTKSILLTRCKICRRQSDSENMLLCDGCNMGHHLYCLKPKLKAIPLGDWYCKKCQKDLKIENPLPEPPTPSKKRRIFVDDYYDEELMQQQEEPVEEAANEEEESEEEEETDETDSEKAEEIIENGRNHKNSLAINGSEETCNACSSTGGEFVTCDQCSSSYHIDCLQPPLRRIPRGLWTCDSCKNRGKKRKEYNGLVRNRAGAYSQRSCATKALSKIQDVTKTLRHSSESDVTSSDDEVIRKRVCRRDDLRDDLPLHNAALQDVLSAVMKDINAWPFLRPVQKIEVPDYYDVITKPMDFGTIKYKLNMGEYRKDAHFMTDVLLVFQNCTTYNHSKDDVYKCGMKLLQLFQKKCREVGLQLPDELDYECEGEDEVNQSSEDDESENDEAKEKDEEYIDNQKGDTDEEHDTNEDQNDADEERNGDEEVQRDNEQEENEHHDTDDEDDGGEEEEEDQGGHGSSEEPEEEEEAEEEYSSDEDRDQNSDSDSNDDQGEEDDSDVGGNSKLSNGVHKRIHEEDEYENRKKKTRTE